MAPTYYITTPIYYVNARPHLGHVYTTVIADALKRYHQMRGYDAYFLTGTDEHGDKVMQAALESGVEPIDYANEISQAFRDVWPDLSISNDDFIRTTQDRHKKVVRDILTRVHEAGDIYFGKYGGHYCYGCERFYTERELVDGLCPDHQKAPTYIEEENYFYHEGFRNRGHRNGHFRRAVKRRYGYDLSGRRYGQGKRAAGSQPKRNRIPGRAANRGESAGSGQG